MITMPLRHVDSLTELNQWAREHRTRMQVVDETWESITYAASAPAPDGTCEQCRYRHHLPLPLALRRRERTFIVDLCHTVNGAQCHHVRPVIAGLSTASEGEAKRQAVVVASAKVQMQRQQICGAKTENLTTHTVQAAVSWTG